MDAIQCLVSRRSIREYKDIPLSQQDIENIVEISQMASCWENIQPIRYVAVLDKNLKNKIADECTKKFPWNTENIHEAPALVILCVIKGLSGYEPDGTLPPPKELTGSLLMPAWRPLTFVWQPMRWNWGALLWAAMMKGKSKKY